MDTNRDVVMGQEMSVWAVQHKHQDVAIKMLMERVGSLEGIVRILSEGHGLKEEIRPTPDGSLVRQWDEARH